MILLARHGHVENPQGVLYGNLPGFHLSATGRSQAAALGLRLRGFAMAGVYSSPLERAVETAAIATARTPVTVAALSDWEPDPSWVGVPWDQIPASHPEGWGRFMEAPWIDGSRAARALRQISASHPGGTVVVFGHQDPLRAAMLSLRPTPTARLRDDPLPQCALRVLDPSTWRVVRQWDPPAASAWPAGAFRSAR